MFPYTFLHLSIPLLTNSPKTLKAISSYDCCYALKFEKILVNLLF